MNGIQPPARHVPQFRPADAGFSLAQGENIEHLIDITTDCHYLCIADTVAYPEAGYSVTLSEVLLEKVPEFSDTTEGSSYLLLPDNSVTMAQALNDAIGQAATPTSLEVGHDLFGELGYVLGRVAQVDGLIPVDLDYHRILFLRDVLGVKLLPPLSFEQFSTPAVAQRKVISALWRTCMAGAGNAYQQDQLPQIFQGFARGFSW